MRGITHILLLILFDLVGYGAKAQARTDYDEWSLSNKYSLIENHYNSSEYFDYDIAYRGCFFERGIYYHGCDFLKSVVVSGSIVDDEAFIGENNFSQHVNVHSSRFYQSVSIGSNTFHKHLDISSSTFEKDVLIASNNFQDILFNGIKAKATFNFGLNTVDGDFDIVNSNFENVKFEFSKFVSDFHITEVSVNSGFKFLSCEFQSNLKIENCEIHSMIFKGCTLPDTLSLNNLRVSDFIDLTGVTLKSNALCLIDLRNSDLERFKIRYDKFKLLVDDRIDSNYYEEVIHMYEQLLKSFKDNGYLTSYEKLDKEYQEFKYLKAPGKSTISYLTNFFLNWLNKNWSDYGYDKARIWQITIFFFLGFSIINWFRLPILLVQVYKIEEIWLAFYPNEAKRIQMEPIISNGTWNKWNFRKPILAIYYTGLIFFGWKMNTSNMNFNRPGSLSYIFIQYTIGLICLAYLANYVISSTLIGS